MLLLQCACRGHITVDTVYCRLDIVLCPHCDEPDCEDSRDE